MGQRNGKESFLKPQATHMQMATDTNSIAASTEGGNKGRKIQGGDQGERSGWVLNGRKGNAFVCSVQSL